MKIDYKLVDTPRKRRHPLRWLMAALLVGAPTVVALALVGETPHSGTVVHDSAVVHSADTLPPVQIQLTGPPPPPPKNSIPSPNNRLPWPTCL